MPDFPSYPQFPPYAFIPGIPPLPDAGQMPGMPGTPAQAGTNSSLRGTFSNFLESVSQEIKNPHEIAQSMVTGQRPFDALTLMTSMLDAERKLNTTVRIINELVKGIKQLEQIQV